MVVAGQASGSSDEGDPLERALALAWSHLERRERTAAEMRCHLALKGVPPEVGEQAIAIIAEQGPLDDRRFARLYVEDKRRLEHWGAERIRRGLLARGVDPELVEAIIEGEDDRSPADESRGEYTKPELQRAVGLLEQRYRHPLGDDRERNRALGLLLRKGYDSEIAYEALRVYQPADA